VGQKAKELSALAVSKLIAPGMHAVGGVDGLYLRISDTSARSWIVRLTVDGKRREMGLGGFPDVTLAEAREKARGARSDLRMGIDPVEQRRQARSARQALKATQRTFADCAKAYIEAHSDGWRNAKHRAQWPATFETYVYPTMGAILVSEITQAHVLEVLRPIWKAKTQTATRLRGRIEQVLSWATAAGYRQGENPARWTGLLDQLLPAPGKVSKVQHHRALPIDQVPAFILALRQHEGLSAKALEFAILTAARSGEVRGATWSEIDLKVEGDESSPSIARGATTPEIDLKIGLLNQQTYCPSRHQAGVWTVPGERMKAGREHRVPLSSQAAKLLQALPRIEGTDYVFPAPRGGQLSDMALTALMRRMKVDAVPHGFRSTFRDWCSERTNYPRDLAEQALAHAIESKVEAAYRRGDALEKRRGMMQAWADYCAPTATEKPASPAPDHAGQQAGELGD
jgi:integrase